MDLSYTDDEIAFREEVRDFLARHLPENVADRVRANREVGKEDSERWHAILAGRGWLAAGWPVEHGGPGWTPVQRHLFEEECARACAPRVVPFGVAMLGPVLIAFGTDAQRAAYLPRILDGTDWWCQGYSEPGAGSDLASLRTAAVRDGDHYVVDGQKTWTTLGQHANRVFCLVRTDPAAPKPQQGISFLLVDLDAPGIEMRPIRLIEGGHEVNEVFLTGVRVPVANRVGAENEGWTIAKYLLSHERSNIAGVGQSIRAFESLRALAREPRRGGRLADDPLFAARLARIEIDLEALRITELRMLSRAAKGGAPGPEASMLKVLGTELRQEINALARRALGPAAAPVPPEGHDGNAGLVHPDHAHHAARHFNDRKISIFGGSNEIQRNILATAMLDL